MFEDLMQDIQVTFTERFLKIQVSAEPTQAPPPPRARAAATAPASADDLFTGGAAPAAPAAAPAPAGAAGAHLRRPASPAGW